MTEKGPRYLYGHHESVLRSHTWRTAVNSAGYLLGYLKPDNYILDIGCGPGTITADFAALVPNGKVLGMDYVPEVLEQGRKIAVERDLKNIEFMTGDIHALPFPDNTFDVVHTHQTLQHIHDPVKALSEMRRVTKPGGLVAARENDISTHTFYPELKELDEFLPIYLRTAESVGGTPKAGRHLIAWARKAGFERKDIIATTSTWSFNTPQDRAWWGELWADRIVASSFAKNAIDANIATQEDLESYAKAWRTWAADEDGWFSMIHGEIICRLYSRSQ
ncbi:hypothetical protein Clacol_007191 [Clathrus columnatus]|uniref:Methyltransferase domain-containing protein n=1 Tax=Clathrus columnatus TaxID=1419009 RepID=A0AAV5AE82_9AGAM|nr:hypothetical protein Clacol_007191 [Clathrus columnatus]